MTTTVGSTAITFNDGTTQSTSGAGGGGTLTSLGTINPAFGTDYTFTGIPTTAKRITLFYNGLATVGTQRAIVVVGNASGLITTGYVGATNQYGVGYGNSPTTSIYLAATSYSGTTGLYGILDLYNMGNGYYVWSGGCGVKTSTTWTANAVTAGAVNTTTGLTQLKVTGNSGSGFNSLGYFTLMYG